MVLGVWGKFRVVGVRPRHNTIRVNSFIVDSTQRTEQQGTHCCCKLDELLMPIRGRSGLRSAESSEVSEWVWVGLILGYGWMIWIDEMGIVFYTERALGWTSVLTIDIHFIICCRYWLCKRTVVVFFIRAMKQRETNLRFKLLKSPLIKIIESPLEIVLWMQKKVLL